MPILLTFSGVFKQNDWGIEGLSFSPYSFYFPQGQRSVCSHFYLPKALLYLLNKLLLK